MKVIEVEHLTKDYGFGRGVFDISFSVEKGEVFGFLGPNGAGKSTTIRHIMGFSKPDKGSTKILGKDTWEKYYMTQKHVGYLPGEIALPDGLTGYQFLKMMAELRNSNNKERLDYLLKKFELNPSGETKYMSLGVKRKLAIVAAFMDDPDVLILDEPTSGLDPVMQEVFINFIKEEKKRGKTILLSSHIFSEVDATCDRIAIIKDGKIVDNFIADDLKHKKDKSFELFFETKKEKDIFVDKYKNYNEAFSINEQKNLIVTILTNDDTINKTLDILSNYKIDKVIEQKATLEDYFMKFYKEDIKFEGVN